MIRLQLFLFLFIVSKIICVISQNDSIQNSIFPILSNSRIVKDARVMRADPYHRAAMRLASHTACIFSEKILYDSSTVLRWSRQEK